MVGYLIDIIDSKIYDVIGVSIPKPTNEQVTMISMYFHLGARITLDESFTFVFNLPSNNTTWIYLRFVTKIGWLESDAS